MLHDNAFRYIANSTLNGETTGGNVSVCVSSERVLLTPTSIDKGNLSADQIAVIGVDGTDYTPDLNPSGELSLHLGIYRQRVEMTGTREFAEGGASQLKAEADAALLQNHGVVTVGGSLLVAFERMEGFGRLLVRLTHTATARAAHHPAGAEF